MRQKIALHLSVSILIGCTIGIWQKNFSQKSQTPGVVIDESNLILQEFSSSSSILWKKVPQKRISLFNWYLINVTNSIFMQESKFNLNQLSLHAYHYQLQSVSGKWVQIFFTFTAFFEFFHQLYISFRNDICPLNINSWLLSILMCFKTLYSRGTFEIMNSRWQGYC